MTHDKEVKFGTTVSVRMMDDDYIVSDCPQGPEHIATMRKRHSYCACLGTGTCIREATTEARNKYGNCAVTAWDENYPDGKYLIGLMTFFPVEVLVERNAQGRDMMVPYQDGSTIAVGNCLFCSLWGWHYRRKGIGTAMAELMVDWAKEAGFKRVAAIDVPAGNPVSWGHHCRPPRPFWEKLGFRVDGKKQSTRCWEEVKSGFQKEIKEAEDTGKHPWAIRTFGDYIQQVESSELAFADYDAHYSLVKDL